MNKNISRSAIVIAAVAASAVAASAAGVSNADASAGQAAKAKVAAGTDARAAPGAQLWVRRYAGPGDCHFSTAAAVAVTPAGGRVFVTGYSARAAATIGYDAATGARLWLRRFRPPGTGAGTGASASAIAVGPNGRTVYVAASTGRSGIGDYATIAYDAATGERLWVTRYNGTGDGGDHASSIAVSPDGTTVFVTGYSWGAGTGYDYATAAYSAATGKQLWVARYNGPASKYDFAAAVAVSPRGDQVFVTGSSQGPSPASRPGYDYATVAYSATSGAQLWARRYTSAGAQSDDFASAIAVGHGGKRVFVTGTSANAALTIAYGASGQRLWLARYQAARRGSVESMAISPSGTMLFITGGFGVRYGTIGYGTGSGRRLWVSFYAGPTRGAKPSAIAVSPDGSKVYVTGYAAGPAEDPDYATVAYRSASGAQIWVRRYNGPARGEDLATAIAVSPRGGRVFVTGESVGASPSGERPGLDYATVAYRG